MRRSLKMSRKSMLKMIPILVLFSMILSACGATATESQAPAETEPAVVETEAPVVETEAPVAAPTELKVAAILTVGLDNAWDRTFVEAYQRVQAEKPNGLTMADLEYTEGVWGDEAETVLRAYAESGEYDIIWAHSTYSDQVKNLKDEFPAA